MLEDVTRISQFFNELTIDQVPAATRATWRRLNNARTSKEDSAKPTCSLTPNGVLLETTEPWISCAQSSIVRSMQNQ